MRYTTMLAMGAVLAVNLALGAGEVGSLVPDSKLKRELDAKLPAESRYAFPQVSEKWIKKVRYVDPVLLKPHEPEKVSEEEKKRFNKEEVLSKTGKEEGDYRVVTYAPAGKVRSVGDRRGEDLFSLSIHVDGTVAGFMHTCKEKVREAYGVSRDGKEVHRVVRGDGLLKYPYEDGAGFARVVYHQGQQYFRAEYMGEKLNFVWLMLDRDWLMRWREGSEEFFIHKGKTTWSADSKGRRLTQLDGVFDLKKIDAGHVKLWEGKYPESLTAFFDRYGKHLEKAGYTWEKLGIEFVRMQKPFPE